MKYRCKKSLGRVLLAVFVLTSMIGFLPQNAMESKAVAAWPAGVDVQAGAAIVMDIDSGTVLYEKNADQQLHPASITKLLTGLVAVENSSLDTMVTFSREAVFENESRSSSHIARDVGEQMSMEDCLYGMLLASANECADAIAEHVGGSIENFVKMMNDKAKELGCENSTFACTNGLTDDGHVTTARDMALIGQAVYRNEALAKIVGTGTYTIEPTNVHTEPTYLINHHEMLLGYRTYKYKYEYCTGGKTGYTNNAHFTLVTFAEKDGKRLVCVILNEQMKNMQYKDTTALFDFFFDQIKECKSEEALDIKSSAVVSEIDKEADPENLSMESTVLTIPAEGSALDIKHKYEADSSADKKTGQIGKMTFTYNERTIGSATVYDKSKIEKPKEPVEPKKNPFAIKIGKTGQRILVVLGILAIVLVVYFLLRKAIINYQGGFSVKALLEKIPKPSFKKRDRRSRRGKHSEEPLWNAWRDGSDKKRRR